MAVAAASGDVQSSPAKPTLGEAIINRHNAWNQWTVQTLHLNKCCGNFLEVKKNATRLETIFKVAFLSLLSHVAGPIVSTIKSAVLGCYNGTTSCVSKCWNSCFSSAKKPPETEKVQEKK